jgi:GDP-4-dehydro-6-deoxy-D-mannose reductase
MQILVTGGTSFTARYLLPLLLKRYPGAAITASGSEATAALAAPVSYMSVDLGSREETRYLVDSVRPEVIFHVAGYGGTDSDRCFRTNLDGTRNLMEASADLSIAPKVLCVSSASVYGLTQPEESPVNESTPLRPVAAYGASKAAAELAALTYHYQRKIPLTVVRPFNLVGPGLPVGLAAADFLEKAKQIRNGSAEPHLRVGNLSAERDFVDIRDAVRAYVDLVESDSGWGKIFNVASGIPVPIQSILAGILSALDLSVEIRQDLDLKQRVEVLTQTGDSTVLCNLTGWVPEFSLAESLGAMARANIS